MDAIDAVLPDWPATRRGRLFVVSGPSGVGKDAVLERLLARMPDVTRSVSATTRLPRDGETDGVDYHFLSREAFAQGIAEDTFLEHAQYGTQYYGTPRSHVDTQREQGRDVILKIEVQGAQDVRRLVPDAVLVFLAPPSIAELERRLRGRGTETEARIAERLQIAQNELACATAYDYLVVNDVLDDAIDALRCIIVAERQRNRNRDSGGDAYQP